MVGFSLLCFCACHAFLIISSCALHLHTCSSHASEHFPRCPFCNPALPHAPAHPSFSFRERVLKVLGMDRVLSSGLGIPPVDHLSSFVPFGVRFMIQRLTGQPQSPFVCCSKTPFKQPKTPLSLFHALGRSITIVWAKTALRLDSPSSL